ncbi:cyclic nucleotide-binding domain-containing protein [Chloroflexi bacterium TSY]|nr:cyclic nucleotide-binding domain-containing protein [Chloroflexi bacterium TSY]
MLLTIEKVAILKSVDIFSNTPDYVLASVAAIAEEVDLLPDETFIQEGDLGDCMYIIVDGEVRVHNDDRILFNLGKGKSVGELAVLDPEPRAASVTAVVETQLFRIDKDAFDEVMADRPEIAQGVIRALCQRVRMTTAARQNQ